MQIFAPSSLLEQLPLWPWTTAVVLSAYALNRWADVIRKRASLTALGGHEALELPGKLPVIGHTHFFAKHVDALNDWIAAQSLAYGGRPWRVSVLGQPELLVLSTPQAMEDVTKTQFDNFPKGEFQCGALRDLFGDGMIGVDGAKWYAQRKIARHLVTMRALRDSMTHIVQKHVNTLLTILDKTAAVDPQDPLAGSGPHGHGNVLDLVRLFREFTIETFAEIAFGIQMESLGSEQEHPFHTSMDAISPLLLLRFRLPSWFWKLQRWLGVGAEGEIARNMKIVDGILMDVVGKSLQGRVNGETTKPSSTTDIISLFLDHSGDGDTDHAPLTPTMLRDIVMVFLVAGRDTSADTLSWFVYMIQQHPRVEAKIRTELDDLFAGKDATSPLTLEQVGKLVYLEAAIRETLRLYPPAALNTREASVDTVLSDGTFVRAGTRIGLSVYSLGRLPSVWGNDASEFKPERWIDPKTRGIISVSPFEFMAFHAGPRSCMGASIAMLEMKLVAAKVLRAFHLDVLPGQDMTQEIGLTLAIKHGLKARIRRVEQ
jgi:cytochrome P450